MAIMSLAYAGKAVMNVEPQVRKPAMDRTGIRLVLIPDHEVLIVRFRHYFCSVLFGVPSFPEKTAYFIINASG